MSSIVFPRPPPTSNKLTHAERAKLLRTTAKLGHVLGSTPHVIDDYTFPPVHVQFPSSPTKSKFGFKSSKSRSSSESTSDSSDDEYESPRSRVNSPDSNSSSPHSNPRSRKSSFTTTHSRRSSVDSEGAWRRVLPDLPARRPPVLRLALAEPAVRKHGRRAGVKPNLETIPGSPPCVTTTYKQSESFSSLTDSDTSPVAPAFNIPSDAAIRREKMRRLTKKLGEGIPMHLVFPPIAQSDDEDVIVDIPSTPSSVATSFNLADSSCSLSPLVPSPHSDSSCSSSVGGGHSFYRHESKFQIPRKSHFVDKPLPPTPTVKTFSGRFVVHYESSGEHGRKGSETFEGLRCAVTGHSRRSSRNSTLEVVQE